MVVSKKDKLSVASGSEKEVSVFSEAEIERILFFVEDSSQVSVRDKLIIYLLLHTGYS
jgi:integrase